MRGSLLPMEHIVSVHVLLRSLVKFVNICLNRDYEKDKTIELSWVFSMKIFWVADDTFEE